MAVPLGQLVGVDVDESTAEAIADWHYLDEPRYRFWLSLTCSLSLTRLHRNLTKNWPINSKSHPRTLKS